MPFRWVVWGCSSVVALVLTGCGGDEPKSPMVMGGAGGSAAGSAQGGSAPGGGAGSGGGSAGKAFAGPLDCSGTFGTPVSILAEEGGVRLASPTLSPDGLELFYSREMVGIEIAFRRSTRSNLDEPFPLGMPVESLDAACSAGEARSIDLSSDGLRAYIVCYDGEIDPTGAGLLHIAERASPTADFSLRSETQPVGPSAAISRDELTLVSSSDIDLSGYPPRQYVRSSTSEPFGAGMDIPGLEAVNMTAPDLSPDGLALYGNQEGVVVVTRTSIDGPFGAPTRLYAPPSADAALGAPELTQDCRTLFYVHIGVVGTQATSLLRMARR